MFYMLPTIVEQNKEVAKGYELFGKIIKYTWNNDCWNDRASAYFNAYVLWAANNYKRIHGEKQENGLFFTGAAAAIEATKLVAIADGRYSTEFWEQTKAAIREFISLAGDIAGVKVMYPLMLGEFAYRKGEGPKLWIRRLNNAGFTNEEIRESTIKEVE